MKTDSININNDSVASVDSITYHAPAYLAGFGNDNYQDSVVEPMSHSSILTVPDGENSQTYAINPLHDTGTMLLFLLSIFFVTICYRNGYKYVSDLNKNLFSLKKRQNIFEDHNNINEILLEISLIANTCIMQGIILECAIAHYYPSVMFSTNIFGYILCSIGSMAVFYLLQFLIYNILGFTFTNKVNKQLLLKGFNASQAVLGLFLLPIVILMLVYPHLIDWLIPIFFSVYILCRLVFIFKGIRIFFNNYYSFLLIILYLCSVEIVPIKLLYNGIIYLFSLF